MTEPKVTSNGDHLVARLSFASFRLSDIESGTDLPGNQHITNGVADEREHLLLERSQDGFKHAKRLLLAVLLVSCLSVSLMTYYFTERKVANEFEAYFLDIGTTVADEIEKSLGQVFQLGSTLAISYSYANESWPNTTLLEFFTLTNHHPYYSVSFLPRLNDGVIRKEWELYAIKNQEKVLTDESPRVSALYGNITRRLMQPAPQPEGDTHGRRILSANRAIEDGIYSIQNGIPFDDSSSPPYWPAWQTAPLEQRGVIMYNHYSDWSGKQAIALRALMAVGRPILSQVLHHDPESWLSRLSYQDPETLMVRKLPSVLLYYPIFDFSRNLVGAINIDFELTTLMQNTLPRSSSASVDVEISNTCDQFFSFRVEGPTSFFVSTGDTRRLSSDELMVEKVWEETDLTCLYTTRVYPSADLRRAYKGNDPLIYTSVVVAFFLFISLIFFIYAWIVDHRQAQLVRHASQTTAIVRSLFPANVRERLFRQTVSAEIGSSVTPQRNNRSLLLVPHTPKIRLKNFLADNSLSDENSSTEKNPSEPIADLFPHTTVMFADIAGFTAWSSEREPSQVFLLLESLYRKFDEVAHKLGVFKVETIGDCYVAVVGLPDPVLDHAVVCARFAFEILYHMHALTTKLEGTLGPGTSDLTLRIGLHSGAVTAGVLRGEKSRFQLFGDTMNTASRIESSGRPDRVHCSQHTADLIIAAGKGNWLTKREGLVAAKGKGEIQTYWLKPRRVVQTSEGETEMKEDSESVHESRTVPANRKDKVSRRMSVRWGVMQMDSQTDQSVLEHTSVATAVSNNSQKKDRLINWNVDVLIPLLGNLVRSKIREPRSSPGPNPRKESDLSPYRILEEVTEIIDFPAYDSEKALQETSPSSWSLFIDDKVKLQLREYVTRLALLYRENPFHNFEHACHVTMSANKLLKRIIHPDDLDYNLEGADDKATKLESLKQELHASTYGISSDPLTQFAIVFSALLHDVDHTGLPNDQLVLEEADVAKRFNNKSVAEQNSLYLAWDILMEPQFEAFRSCIFSTETETKRFRQLLVNSVMATDIVDKEQQLIRKKRWEKAFFEDADQDDLLDINRKATAVLEHIIQASDVAHTMQHWRIYCKWNERYFREKYFAWKCGRAEKDPSDGWYDGEIWFFDNYIIPLARKLKESGVFGVSSDEYLQYALENRQEWELKGIQVCHNMLANAIRQWEDNFQSQGAETKNEDTYMQSSLHSS